MSLHHRIAAMAAACVVALATVATAAAGAGEIARVELDYEGTARSYHVYAPPDRTAEDPVLVLLHGSGRRGDSLVGPWRALADEHRILLVAPDSAHSEAWNPGVDGVYFLRAVLAHAAERHPYERDRVALFGHSGGAVWALQMGLIDPRTYAAVSVHAGALPEAAFGLIEQARRKRPIQIQVGERDPHFPPATVRATADALAGAGFTVAMEEIPKHDHDYSGRADEINAAAWTFLSDFVAPGIAAD